MKQLPNFLLASPVLSLAIYSIIHYTKMLHQLLQTTSIHRQIINALEERSVESYKKTDDMTVLRSELSAGLTNKAHGTITISVIYVLLFLINYCSLTIFSWIILMPSLFELT